MDHFGVFERATVMAEHELTSLAAAIEFAISVLEPFRESSLYNDYQDEDGWTDEQFQTALDVLHAASARDELARQHYFIVDAGERTDARP
jgi:hypothetical protein